MSPAPEDSLREHFEQHGYAVVPGLYSNALLARLAEAVDEIQGWPETPHRHMMYFEAQDGARILNRVENFVPYHEMLSHEISRGLLAQATERVLGEPPTLFKDKINFKLPGGGGFEAHQDAQAGWNRYADYFVTAAVAIDRATLANGCLELAHWKHRHELIGPLWQPLTDEHLGDIPFEPLPMEPGDAVLFDSYLPHRSAPNTSDSARRVLYITYNKSSAGDHRERYYADKRESFPPDCERDPKRHYEYRV